MERNYYLKVVVVTIMATENEAGNVSVMSRTIQLSPTDDVFGDKPYPLVFKCAKCSQIIGDSISWVCTNEDLRAITLKRTIFPPLSACSTADIRLLSCAFAV